MKNNKNYDIQVLRDIYSTIKPAIGIEAISVKDYWYSKNTRLYQSKFGGIPYLPKNIDYPRTKESKPLYLLAQINFVDAPFLEPFPRDGLLQIYIENNELYGMGYGYEESSYKILYIPHPKNYDDYQDLSFLETPEDFPIEYPHILNFYNTQKPISALNPNFSEIFEKYIKEDDEEPDFCDLYSLLIDDFNHHQIGGYPSFVQHGPYLEKDKEYEVLLQIDSDSHINFGDAGIATFLILKEDLKKLDFSKVVYHWDCC
ncbi:MAG TPA: DUF1963 domain-containing protein [Rickettsia endosymbiont of Pyrocoelia pectoralis]|nr:DUF1963 domain-containing protein [Rickettsia endosymbiont of Pyrocoelia pectoralis]